MPRKRPLNSAIHIARLLECEGFTDHTASELTRFAVRQMTPRQLAKFRELKNGIGKVTGKLTIGDKLMIGRFIGLHKSISFQTGLKMGIAAAVVSKPINITEFEIE